MPFLDAEAPKKVKGLKARWMPDGYYLFWREPKAKSELDVAKAYVVYRFAKGEDVDLERAENIVAITSQTLLKLPYHHGTERYKYVVTALDRLHNESKPVSKKVKL
jgi:hypothetical protein